MKIKGAFPVRWQQQPGKDGTGVTVRSQTIQYAVSTSGTARPSSGWKPNVPTVPDGQYLWTWLRIVFSDNTETNLYSVSRQGVDGKGIRSSVVSYSQQAMPVDPETITNWGAFPSSLTDGYWLYTKTHIVYSDGEPTDSYSVSQIGTGAYYAGTAEYWAIGTSPATPPDGAPKPGTYVNGQAVSTTWSQDRLQTTAAEPYLWNFEISSDSRGNRYVTDAICIGNFAKGISSIVETYAISALGTPESGRRYPSDIADADWKDEQQAVAPTDEKRYQWNRTVVSYNSGSPDYFYHVSAVKGIDGKGATYIDLDNENDSMLYDGAGVLLSGSVTSNIRLYSNGERVTNPPSFSIQEKSSSVTASISGSVLTVTGITANSGYVIVQCVFDGVTYTARMTVKRLVGVDRFELELTPNQVSYNTTTQVASAAAINVKVWRTPQNGARHLVEDLGDYGLIIDVQQGTSTEHSVIRPSWYDGGVSYAIQPASYPSYTFKLIEQGATDKVLDTETIPVNTVGNGPQGDKGNDAVLYDIVFEEAWARADSNNVISAVLRGYAYKVDGSVRTPMANTMVRYGYNVNDEETYAYSTTDSAGYFSADTWFDGDEFSASGFSRGSQSIFAAIVVGSTVLCVKFVTIVKDGAKGQPGASGSDYLPLYMGIYNPGAEYSWKDGIRHFVDFQVDGTYYRYGVKKKGTTVPVNTPPESLSNGAMVLSDKWEKAHVVQTLLTNCLFGTNANIGGLVTTDERMVSTTLAYQIEYWGDWGERSYWTFNVYTVNGVWQRPMVQVDGVFYVQKKKEAFRAYSKNQITNSWRLATDYELEVLQSGKTVERRDAENKLLDIYAFVLDGRDRFIGFRNEDDSYWNVDRYGNQEIGTVFGKHVELSPVTEGLSFFNEKNELSLIVDGTTQSTIDDIFSDSVGTLTVANSLRAKEYDPYNDDGSIWYSHEDVSDDCFAVKPNSIIDVEGFFVASANRHIYVSKANDYMIPRLDSADGSYYYYNQAQVWLSVLVYSDTACSNLITSVRTKVYGAWNNNTMPFSIKESLSLGTFAGGVRTGYCKLAVETMMLVQRERGNMATVAWTGVKATVNSSIFLSRLFANGFSYGSSAKNFIAAVQEAAGLHVKALTGNGNFGFEVTTAGVYVTISGKRYELSVSGDNRLAVVPS